MSPSLRGSGLKSVCNACPKTSAFLYEGVDWNIWSCTTKIVVTSVSLFTREWIEITLLGSLVKLSDVSLFTREWIEIRYEIQTNQENAQSPSLRGSGLKSLPHRWDNTLRLVSLFTREWIEIKDMNTKSKMDGVSLFTREWIEIWQIFSLR